MGCCCSTLVQCGAFLPDSSCCIFDRAHTIYCTVGCMALPPSAPDHSGNDCVWNSLENRGTWGKTPYIQADLAKEVEYLYPVLLLIAVLH